MAEQEGVLRLSADLQEIPVVLTSKKNGEMKWRMVELDGEQRNKYLNQMSSRVKVGVDGKTVGIKSFDGFQSDLLVRCLIDEKGDHVEKEVIEALPASTQQELFRQAQKLSGLDNKKDDEGNG